MLFCAGFRDDTRSGERDGEKERDNHSFTADYFLCMMHRMRNDGDFGHF